MIGWGTSCNYYCRPLSYWLILLTQCYLKILMFFKFQKYKGFVKYMTNTTVLCCPGKWNHLNLYAVMKQESFHMLLLWSPLVLNLAQRAELICEAKHISYTVITLRRKKLENSQKRLFTGNLAIFVQLWMIQRHFQVYLFFMWVVSSISACNDFMPMHNGLNALYNFWDAKWMKKHRWKLIPAVKWHLEHIVVPTSLYIMKIKKFS